MPQPGLVKKQLFGAAHLETIGAKNQKLELYWESLYIQKQIGEWSAIMQHAAGSDTCAVR